MIRAMKEIRYHKLLSGISGKCGILFGVFVLTLFASFWGGCTGETVVAAKADVQTPDEVQIEDSTEGVHTIHEIYTSSSPDTPMNFPQERKFEDGVGVLQRVEYEILKEEVVTRKKTDEWEVDLPWNRYFPRAEAVLEREGIRYSLADVYVIDAPVTDRHATMIQRVQYEGYTETPEVEQSWETSYYDAETGETLPVSLPLVTLEKTSSWWRKDLTFTLRAEDVTADYYELGGQQLPIDHLPEPEQYPAILDLLNLNRERYHINQLQWDREAQGVILGRGSRYASDYEAVYEAEIALPDISGFRGRASYVAEWEEETGEIIYTIQASAIYQKTQEQNLPVGTIVGGTTAGAGVFFVILLYRRRKKPANP